MQNCWRPQIIQAKILEALREAGEQHHQLEETDGYFEGERDPNWFIWYAAYVMSAIPMLKGAITPSNLVDCIQNTPDGYGDHEDWFDQAANYITDNLTISCFVS